MKLLTQEIQQLIEKYQSLVLNKTVSKKDTLELDGQVCQMIFSKISSIEHMNLSRRYLLYIALGLLAFAIAIITLTSNVLVSPFGIAEVTRVESLKETYPLLRPIIDLLVGPFPPALTALGFWLILLSIVTIILYTMQVKFAYPFNAPGVKGKEIGNSWRWFYYGAIQSATPVGPILRMKSRQSYLKYYLEDLTGYTDKTFTLVNDASKRLKENTRQLFLLIEVERQHARFILQLSRLLTWGLVSGIVIFCGYLIAVMII